MQKINLSTLIVQKEKLGRKSDHLTHLGIKYYRSRDLILEKVSCCVELVFVRKKKCNLILSSIKQDAFLSTEFSNWKKALEKLKKHESANCHLEAASTSVIWETLEDVGEMFSDTLSEEKFENGLRTVRNF